jgi:hypothetical protein
MGLAVGRSPGGSQVAGHMVVDNQQDAEASCNVDFLEPTRRSV